MQVSLIISYYKNLPNLKLIFEALNLQINLDFEVVLSEDDNNQETIDFLDSVRHSLKFPVFHIQQDVDNGFRKNIMLNKSILTSNYNRIVFIDGDCIPHRGFIKAYIDHFDDDKIMFGRRVMLGEEFSKKLLKTTSIQNLKLLNVIFSDSFKRKEAVYSPRFSLAIKERGLLGCNWGIHKKHLLDVNGFDIDYIKAGVGEDTDIEWRLRAKGLKMKSMKNIGIVYHLYHPQTYSDEGVQANFDVMYEKQKLGHVICLNGFEQVI